MFGDNYGNETCGGSVSNLGPQHAKVDETMPAFKRMVSYLVKEGIEPTIWDGERAITLTKEEIAEALR